MLFKVFNLATTNLCRLKINIAKKKPTNEKQETQRRELTRGLAQRLTERSKRPELIRKRKKGQKSKKREKFEKGSKPTKKTQRRQPEKPLTSNQMLKLKTFNYLMIALKSICIATCMVWCYKCFYMSNTYLKLFGIGAIFASINLVPFLSP